MKFRNIKKADKYRVQEWITKELNLTEYQKRKMIDEEIIRFAPFDFYEDKQKTTNIFIRLSIIFYPFVWCILFIFLPLTYLFKGRWGYGKNFDWFYNWSKKLGL